MNGLSMLLREDMPWKCQDAKIQDLTPVGVS